MPKNFKYTNDELISAAGKFCHKSDFKKADKKRYSMASYRAKSDPEFCSACFGHMMLKPNPYSGNYQVYAYEFSDRHVYVGITFQPESRHRFHKIRGPVKEHADICPDYELKTIESEIASPEEAAVAEKREILRYRSNPSWVVLNKSSGGSLGTVQIVTSKEDVLESALRYRTRTEWCRHDQVAYGLAKERGWFEEATEHMPRYNSTWMEGRKFSEETREKMRLRAKARESNPLSRIRHSAVMRGRTGIRKPRKSISIGRPKGWRLTPGELEYVSSLRGVQIGNPVILTGDEVKLIRTFRRNKIATAVSGLSFGNNREVYLIVGASGSGKSWVVDQLSGCSVIKYDEDHFSFPLRLVEATTREIPIVCETGFKFSELVRTFRDTIKFKVCVVVEEPGTVFSRLVQRGGGDNFTFEGCRHFTRKAVKFGKKHAAFSGTSQQVLDYLKAELAKQ